MARDASGGRVPGPGRVGRLGRLRGVLSRRRGWLGFGVGIAVGATAGALLATLLPALLTPPGLEPGPLVILSGRDDSPTEVRKALVRQWNALHPANQATIRELPANADDQHSEMVAEAQSDTGRVDIYNLDVTAVAEFAHEKYLRPLRETDSTTEGFLDKPLATCRYDGALWALPFNSDAGLLFYRKDLVPAPPINWGSMTDDIARVFAPGATHDSRLEAGYTAQLSDYEGLTVNALEAIWAAGGTVVDGQNRVRIDSPEAVEGLRELAEGLHPPQDTDLRVVLPAATDRDYDETRSTNSFLEGKVLFLRNWPLAYRTLRPDQPIGSAVAQSPGTTPGVSTQPAASAPTPLQFGVRMLFGSSVLGGQDLAIASGSRHPRAAQALIEFLTSERSQQILFERGGFAATREVVYHDQTVTTEYPYAELLLRAIQGARLRPVTPHYARFSQAFRAVVNYALEHDGQLPPDATKTLSDALKGY
jgi:multiple sugar transport system substrate-binding protein